MKKDVAPIREDFEVPNYDMDKIAPCTLEDPLTFFDGRKVETPAQWRERR
jgi:hypothetical protein